MSSGRVPQLDGVLLHTPEGCGSNSIRAHTWVVGLISVQAGTGSK